MTGTTDVEKDFATPDRSGPQLTSLASSKQKDFLKQVAPESSNTEKAKAATVTPPESMSRDELMKNKKKESDSDSSLARVASQVDSPDDRHVRFDKEMDSKADPVADSPSSNESQRGLVSRRGGRCASPGRVSKKSPPSKDSVLEFKTYRSPPRKKREESDTVPSLCSDKEKGGRNSKLKQEDGGSSNDTTEHRKPASISCDSSLNQTSPLAPDEAKSDEAKAESSRATSSRRNNVSFSPVPPSKDNSGEKPVKTPTRSPTGRFQSLPNLDDSALASPGGMFLSPHPPTPKEKTEVKVEPLVAARSPKTPPRSPRTPKRELDRDRFLATPTDFATDYGKHPTSGSFDTSNVLAWLQSPTANGLFSPGGLGLGSIMNTPKGVIGPRTPRTPTVSTSFFFSDVASLPRSGDYPSPKPGADVGKRSGSGRGAYSNIICISPLASSKSKNGSSHAANTPTINYKDMFASPAEKSRGLSLLGDSPMKGSRVRSRSASKDPNLDAVHMAERDLMEDEDLSVLLQLASNTPKSTGDRPPTVSTSEGTHVFRSPNGRSKGHSGDDNLPSLQLPIIGGRESEGNGTRLSRKTHSRDHGDANDEYHRSLSMRSHEGKSTKNISDRGKDEKKRKDGPKTDKAKKKGKSGGLHPPPHPYMASHAYGHPENSYYPHMPPGMPPHGGSMRVVVGGPPPSRSSKSAASPHGPVSPPRYGMPHGDYPPYPPAPGHYAHHPGVPPHMHPYAPYPPHHHPPPRHMPMYGAQHPAGKPKPKKITSAAKGTKRAAPSQTPKPSSGKKSKKTSHSGGPKKKNKSPQLTDKVDRQRAAAAIQAVNQASGGKNDKAAALAAAILRGVTMRPSGKWQAQLYFAGKSRYIGVFDTREKAALAYEIAREKLKAEKLNAEGGTLSAKATEAAVNAARKAAFEGVNERDPRLPTK